MEVEITCRCLSGWQDALGLQYEAEIFFRSQTYGEYIYVKPVFAGRQVMGINGLQENHQSIFEQLH